MAQDEWLMREYFALSDTIDHFDQRLLTIKGWGVTVGLASLGLGFHTMHYGLFLVAAVSGASFLIIEGLTKRHQMRHYLRMREIEVMRAADPEWNGSPQIDWRWTLAGPYFLGELRGELPPPEPYGTPYRLYRFPRPWLGMVALPHAITIVLGLLLFTLGLLGMVGTAP